MTICVHQNGNREDLSPLDLDAKKPWLSWKPGLSVSKKFDTLPGGIQYPLDTPLVPDETSGDTPGFAPQWARVVV